MHTLCIETQNRLKFIHFFTQPVFVTCQTFNSSCLQDKEGVNWLHKWVSLSKIGLNYFVGGLCSSALNLVQIIGVEGIEKVSVTKNVKPLKIVHFWWFQISPKYLSLLVMKRKQTKNDYILLGYVSGILIFKAFLCERKKYFEMYHLTITVTQSPLHKICF